MLTADMLRRATGAGVGVGVASEGEVENSPAEPDELPSGAPAGRRASFTLGRIAARRALMDFGEPAQSIPVGPEGSPAWPPRIVGSVAHTAGVGVAVVGWAALFAGLGVDVEAEGRVVTDGVRRRICTLEEAAWVSASQDPALALKRVFCAKEATYKALAARAGYFGFHDVRYTDAGPDRLEGVVLKLAWPDELPRSISARTVVAAGFVVACVAVPTHAGE